MWWSRKHRQGARAAAPARPVAELLEPRILYSADIAAGLLLAAGQQPGAQNPQGAEQRILDADGEYGADTAGGGASADGPAAATLASATPAAADTSGLPLDTADGQAVALAYAASALHFEANAGQAPANIDFLARGSGYDIALSGGNVQLTLAGGDTAHQVGLSLLGGHGGAAADPQGLLAARSNYLLGTDSGAWLSGIANYAAVTYRGVYDGIDVQYYGTQRQLEYDFLVAAGADPGQIRLGFTGIQSAAIADNGDLVLALAGGGDPVRFRAPVSWQQGPGGAGDRQAVQSAYVIHADGSIGFQLGEWDRTRALVIDPILSYATYFGGTGPDTGLDVAVGPDGSVYMTGRTASALGSLVGSGGGGGDIFVAKYSADLSTLIYTTRIGGSGDEQGNAIAVDAAGNAAVTGWTKSANFPVVSAVQATRSGPQDAFVFKLDATGTALGFSTYLGGTGGSDAGNDITVDTGGNIYAVGQSSDLSIGGTLGLGDLLGGLLGKGDDAFITKFNNAGALQYGVLYGGGGKDVANGIAVDAAGNAYVVGSTGSSGLGTANAHDGSYNGDDDGFLVKLNASGSTVLYATYIGADKEDAATAVAVDAGGNVYVTGTTKVTGSTNFQVTGGALQTSAPSGTAGFVRVYDLSRTGSATLVYSSFLTGDKNNNLPTGIAIDALGRIVVAGHTDSRDFPVTSDAVQGSNNDTALFLVVINPGGAGRGDLVYGTYYGSGMTAGGLAVNGMTAYLSGTTNTGGLATPGANRVTPAGGAEAFVAGFDLGNAAPVLTGSNPLAAVVEDAAAGNGTLVSALIAGRVTDASAGALFGIAVTAADSTNGSWQYSLNGGTTWAALGAPSAASALLLAADSLTRVRFIPAANFAGTVAAGLTFRAWDRTTGTAGGTASTLANGGNTAFSAATASASINVTPVNDAPVLTAGTIGAVTLQEDSPSVSLGLAGLSYGPGGGADEAGQSLTYTVTAVPAAALGRVVLADGATQVAAGNNYSLAELRGMRFLAAADAAGGPATFAWRVTDNGGTAGGGVNALDQSLTISVTPVNDAPMRTAGAVASLTVREDAGATSLGLGGLAYSAGPGASEAGQALTFTVVTVPPAGLGRVVLDDGTTTVIAGANYSLAQLRGMKFLAAANASGGPAVFGWQVRDDGGTTGGGADTLQESLSLTVTAVNDAPVRTAGTVLPLSVPEDAAATSLGLGALTYGPGGGAEEAGQTLAYSVTAVPPPALGRVVLADGVTAVLAGANYTLAELRGMRFLAAPDANGGPAVFSWNVTDSGGTANGGVNVLSESLTISVGAVNDAPVRTAGNVANLTVPEDAGPTSLGLGAVAYAPGGGADEASQALAITVDAVPAAALGAIVLADGTTAVVAGASYTLAQLRGMQFIAAPDANGGPAAFSWRVTDSGGTAGGGADTLVQSLTVTVTAVNDAPVRTAGTVANLSVLEDAPATSLGLGALAYAPGGGADEAAQTLVYTVTAVPPAALGGIVLGDGVTGVVAGASYTLAELRGMQFRAAPDGSGGPAVFAWRVTDSGGTAGGGVNALAQSLTITVTGVNDAPAQSAGTVADLTVREDAPATSLGLGALAYTSGAHADEPGQSLTYTVTTVPPPALGSVVLADGTTAVTAGTAYSLAELRGMRFLAAANANGAGATFAWTVRDDGGTAGGGADTLAQSLAIQVVAVNDAPVRTAGTVSDLAVAENAPATPLGLAGLSYGPGGGADEAAQTLAFTVTAVPAAAFGSIVLADGTTLVTAGTAYTLAQLRGMQFLPAFNAGGGPVTFAWSVTDSGGTADGGADTLVETLDIRITTANQAPVLAGANAMGGLLEDAASNNGTLVSALIAGQVTDANANAAYGIAVTGVANTGGSWQYSRNGGTSWADFGTPDDAHAVLLAANPATRVRFVPDADWSGNLPAGITFRAWDRTSGMAGGTADASANGGATAFSSATASAGITVTPVNDAPVRTGGTPADLVVGEDAGPTSLGLGTLAYGSGGGADEAGQLLAYTVNAVPAASLGMVVLADGTTPVVAGGSYSLTDLRGMRFIAAANAVGGPAVFGWTVTDDGGTADGGADSLAQSLSITVTPVNDAPVRTGGTIGNLVVLEDSAPVSLGLAGLAYGPGGGADEAGQALRYAVTAVPAASLGTVFLADGRTPVAAGGTYLLSELQGMLFAAAADASGGPAVFAWTVADDGGTAAGGADTLGQSLTITVTAVNDAPVRTGGATLDLTVAEDAPATSLGLGGLAYVAGGGEAGQALTYTVTAVPPAALGAIVLADGTTLVAAGASYLLAELQGMKFLAAPDASGGPTVFSWTVTDDGGTANGGANALAQSLTITVGAVNDAPVRTAGSVADLVVPEDAAPASLGLAGLAYGPGGGAAEAGQSLTYTVTAVPAPALGSIVLADGVTVVTAGSNYSLAQLQGMMFAAAPDAAGGPATFSWTVTDDGGTASGGSNALVQSLAIRVAAVNDAPVRTGGTVAGLQVLEDAAPTPLGLSTLAYAPGPGTDEAGQQLVYTVTAVPPAALGSIVLADGVTQVTAGTEYLLSELQGMMFLAAPDASGGPGSFSWTVSDDGGTAGGGSDSLTETLTVGITAVNDAPVRAGGAAADLAVGEDAAPTSLGLGALQYGTGGGADEAAQQLTYTVTAVPPASLGSVVLADGVTAVTAGSNYGLAQLRGMMFIAAPDANGGPATFAWTVSDDGGTANGGADALAQSMTITVAAVNDAPVRLAGDTAPVDVAHDAGLVDLGLGGLAYGPGGGADEAGQSLAYSVTTVPDAALGRVVLADGVTAVAAGGSYTLGQLRGMRLLVDPAGPGGSGLFSWRVSDGGGTLGGGIDGLEQSVALSFGAAPAAPPVTAPPPAPAPADPTPAPAPPAEPPAPAPAAAAPAAPVAPVINVPALPIAPPAPSPEPDAAPAPAPVAAAAAFAPSGAGARGDAGVAAALDGAQAPGGVPGFASPPESGAARGSVMAFDAAPAVVQPLSLDRRYGGLATAEPVELAPMTFDVRVAGVATSADAIQRTLRSEVFVEELDRMREDVRRDFNLDRTVAISAGTVTFGISVIYVLWLIRGGVLMGSYLSALPAWRVLDPLPVLPHAGGGDSEEEDALEAAVDDPGDPFHSLRGY